MEFGYGCTVGVWHLVVIWSGVHGYKRGRYRGAYLHGHEMEHSTYETEIKARIEMENGSVMLTRRTYERGKKEKYNGIRLIILKHLVFQRLPRFSGEQLRTISDKPIRSSDVMERDLFPAFRCGAATIVNQNAVPSGIISVNECPKNTLVRIHAREQYRILLLSLERFP